MNDEEANLRANRLWQPTTVRWFYVVFGSCVAYAVIRYHIAGDVAWRHFLAFPLFVKRNLVYERRRRGLN